jgi:hypothetical protein
MRDRDDVRCKQRSACSQPSQRNRKQCSCFLIESDWNMFLEGLIAGEAQFLRLHVRDKRAACAP